MSAQEILAELPTLSAEDLELIARAVRDLEASKQQATTAPDKFLPRVAGLHAGAMVMAPDFDDPLPDEFWFGKDA